MLKKYNIYHFNKNTNLHILKHYLYSLYTFVAYSIDTVNKVSCRNIWNYIRYSSTLIVYNSKILDSTLCNGY